MATVAISVTLLAAQSPAECRFRSTSTASVAAPRDGESRDGAAPHVLRMPCYVSRTDVETVSLRLASGQQVLARV
jgi:hypothetical protein